MSALNAFNTQLVAFFEELTEVIPEEKDVKMALEAIKGAKKINPRLIVDLFYEHVYSELNVAVMNKDIKFIQKYAHMKISTQFNEIMPALSIFDKYWDMLTPTTHEAIWKYMKVLCLLCEKARGS
jgi:GTP1/Obg family GTP-binding protein